MDSTILSKALLFALLASTALTGRNVALAQDALSTDTTVLDPLIVIGAGDEASTEGVDSYRSEAATISSRLPMTIRETPRSVSVVTRQRLDDEALFTDLDAIALSN